MKARNKRLAMVVLGLSGLGIAAALVLNAFQDNLVFFFSPSQVKNNEAPVARTFRLGGLVKEGSLKRENDGVTVHFVVTDNAENINVTYKGILPDLFQEGKGVITQGKLGGDGNFAAAEVLAKHDENYMPKEVEDALEQAKQAKGAAVPASTVVNN